MGRPFGAKSIRVGAKVRLEDGFQDQLQCTLHHAVADTRNLKRSNFALPLRNLHPAVRPGLIPACEEVFPYAPKEVGESVSLDIRKTLPIDARSTPVSLGDTISLLQGLDFRNVHEQTPEAMRLVRLRLSIDPPPQLLQTDGCLCHLTPASPCRTEYS